MNLFKTAQLDEKAVWKVIKETKKKVLLEEYFYDCSRLTKDIIDIVQNKLNFSETMTILKENVEINDNLGKTKMRNFDLEPVTNQW